MTLSTSVTVPPPSSPSKRKSYKTKLPPSFQPGMYTVICGRGKHCSKSTGNKHLLQLVKYFCVPYSMAKTKTEKSDIVSKIINHIREASNCGDGIFVKAARASNNNNNKDAGSTSSSSSSSEWWEVDEAFAREKIGCMFRDLLHNQYQSSSKAKQARKKQADAAQQEGGNINMNDQSIMSSSSNTMMMMPLPVCNASSPYFSSSSSTSSSSSLCDANTPMISKGGIINTCFPTTRKTMIISPPYDLCTPSPPTAKVTPTMYGSSSSSFVGSALSAALASEVEVENQDNYQQYNNATTTITHDTTRPTTASSLSIIQEACQLISDHDDKLVNLDNEFAVGYNNNGNMEGNDIFLDDLLAGEDLSTIFD